MLFPSDYRDIGSLHNNTEYIHLRGSGLSLALRNYEKYFEIRRKRLLPNHPHIDCYQRALK